MKNKKLKIFVYLSVLLGFLVSCRTDFVNEQIVKKNNTSSLTTKRISLKESPHRQRLTPLLSELNKNLNNGYNSQKSVNFGDSIIVDTDDIIMMENGTNFHTYTFKVKRTNAKPNDPVENIVLSPLSDGKYLELYVVYNLSENEKKKILEGKFVDTKNKKQITKIINGNFSNALLSKSGMLDCGWVDTGAFVTECSDGVHGMWNQDKWNECVADSKPGWHWTMTYHCDYIHDVNENNGHNGIGNNGNTGGGAFPCPDCPAPEPCVQVPTSPTPSTTITDENGCVVGLPTTPNIDLIGNDECSKAKNGIYKANNILKDPKVKTNMTNELSNKIAEPNEWAVGIGQNTDGSYNVTSPKVGNVSNGTVPTPIGDYTADGHSHSNNYYGSPSAEDFYSFLENIINYPKFNTRFVFGTSPLGSLEIYALVITDKASAIDFLSKYPKTKNIDSVKHSFLEQGEVGIEYYDAYGYATLGIIDNSTSTEYDSKALAMAYILEKLNTGISLAKMDNSGNLKKLNVTIEKIKDAAGGNQLKTGLKVTKCP